MTCNCVGKAWLGKQYVVSRKTSSMCSPPGIWLAMPSAHLRGICMRVCAYVCMHLCACARVCLGACPTLVMLTISMTQSHWQDLCMLALLLSACVTWARAGPQSRWPKFTPQRATPRKRADSACNNTVGQARVCAAPLTCNPQCGAKPCAGHLAGPPPVCVCMCVRARMLARTCTCMCVHGCGFIYQVKPSDAV